MNLFIKQRVFSWGDKFTIYDENGNDLYHVQGEVFSFGKKLHVYKLSGEEAAYIEQKPFSFLPKYIIYVNGTQIATVIKRFAFFRQAYSIEELGWTVEGNLFAHEYTVSSASQTVARVSKEWFTFGDAYAINVSDKSDELAALCAVLVIDACIAASRSSTTT